MKYGLSLNINETMSEIVEKSVEIERLGFDYIWVSDVPSQRYSPTVASAIAGKTEKIRIGLGLLSPLLHNPSHIANSLRTLIELYGERFELCIGPGDLDNLKKVGIEGPKLKGIPELLLKAKEEIARNLQRDGLRVPTWLGAQGPKVLKLASFFDGVLLNYAHPDFVKWAIKKMDIPSESQTRIGIYAPSYIYLKEKEKIRQLLLISSAVVVLGSSKSVLKTFGLYDKLAAAKAKLEKGTSLKAALEDIPVEILEKFAIHMHSSDLRLYLSRLKEMGVEQAVFSYPQNFSKETIKTPLNSLLA